jgi:hypothetical protein
MLKDLITFCGFCGKSGGIAEVIKRSGKAMSKS